MSTTKSDPYPFGWKGTQYAGYTLAALKYAARDAWEAVQCMEETDPATGRPVDSTAAGWYRDDLATIRAEMWHRCREAERKGPYR